MSAALLTDFQQPELLLRPALTDQLTSLLHSLNATESANSDDALDKLNSAISSSPSGSFYYTFYSIQV